MNEKDTTNEQNELAKTDIALREEKVLQFWSENDIFQKSVERDAPKGDFIFNDGPPFATGTPHYGHLVASAIKDAVPRYWTMQGYRVERQWGWDCHGLPLENIVEKELHISGRKDILTLGVKKFNDTCRERIKEVSDEWGKLIPRFGRWADMDNPYRTMDKTFMESEWWVFKQLYDKGYVYEDYRSIHICPRCETTLSQSEVTEGYKMVKDLTVTVMFPLKDDASTSFLAWTTTPWTLPGNTALAVGNDIKYVLVEKKDEKTGDTGRYILAKEALERVFKDGDYKIVEEMKGSELVGKEYIPPFDSYINDDTLENRENGWKVYAADFITTDTGTGLAHEAPAFGAEDLDLAHEVGLPIIQHVGMDGIIKPEVVELAGLHVKPKNDPQATDVEVIKYLAKKGILFAKEKYEHSYPHCWRCDTPLLNYVTSSWFVAVEKMKPKLLEYAKSINWSPAHMKKGRWGNWLEGARDWSISRQRFWANTIPVWRCNTCTTEEVMESIADLKEKSGVMIDDLHKDVVDEITYPCACGGTMRRVPDVLDTWFNSGSVPFASHHYPFENKEKVDQRMPADFIAEGTDQTRAWFYYQHVLIGGVFEKPAFKNVIVNGMVMAEDGKKMSKKLKNYPDPTYILDTYGADATRLYILSSPVVRAEDFNFIEREVAQVASKVMGRLVNVYSLYALYKDTVVHHCESTSENVLDRWIIARMHQMHSVVTSAMNAYELDKATRPLGEFVDDLSTWYVRRSRDRLKSDDADDAKSALTTMRWILREYAKVSAPFTPFIAEWLWERVKEESDAESVHLSAWGEVQEPDTEVLEVMEQTRAVVSSALEKRAEAGIKVRQPIATLKFSISNFKFLKDEELLKIISEEINVKKVTPSEDIKDDVWIDTEITAELKKEGEAREVIRAIQNARKQNDFELNDKGIVTVSGSREVLEAVEAFKEEIEMQTNTAVTIGEEKEETKIRLEKG